MIEVAALPEYHLTTEPLASEVAMLDMKGNKITYYGHSTFGLTTSTGQMALIDPWVMTNPKCPDALKKVARLDAIFLTHGHTDHIGRLTCAGETA